MCEAAARDCRGPIVGRRGTGVEAGNIRSPPPFAQALARCLSPWNSGTICHSAEAPTSV